MTKIFSKNKIFDCSKFKLRKLEMRNKKGGAAGASASNFNFPRMLFVIALLLLGAKESPYWLTRCGFAQVFRKTLTRVKHYPEEFQGTAK